MYESHYVCHFFRLWGAKEGAKGISPDTPLLGNMQNDFDAKFGDVAGKSGCRYFLIEFKANRAGFKNEVSGAKAKLHREKLYQHLINDRQCRDLARIGHFAAYPDSRLDYLQFEPYAHSIAPISTINGIAEKIIIDDDPWHELDYTSFFCGFDQIYEALTNRDCQYSETSPGFYQEGLGLTKDQMKQYVNCMYSHLKQGVDKHGQVVLGVVDPATGAFVSFIGSLDDLVHKLQTYFVAMERSIRNQNNQANLPRRHRP